MAKSIAEQLNKRMKWEDVFSSILDLKQLDISIYECLLQMGGARVEELCVCVSRDKNSVYKSLQRLITHGLVYREIRVIKRDGYYYLYYPNEPERVYHIMKRNLTDWYAMMDSLLKEFCNTSLKKSD